MEDRVILDTMDDVWGPPGSYPEGFVSLYLFLAEIYKFVVLVKKRDIHTHRHTDIHTLLKFNIDKKIYSVHLYLKIFCDLQTANQLI